MSVVAKGLDGSRRHLVWRKASTQATLCCMGTQLPPTKKRGTVKAINKEKLPQLGYTTDHNSYWLANVVRLLDAILTPGQRIERDLSYRRSCDRKNDLLPILQNVTVTDTRHWHSSHSSPTLVTDTVTDTNTDLSCEIKK